MFETILSDYGSVIYLDIPCMIVFGILILFLSLITIGLILKSLKKKERKKELLAEIAVLTVIILIGLSLEVVIYTGMIARENHETLVYSVRLDSMSTEPEIVYLPLCTDEGLREEIKLIEGNGEFEITNTEYGDALKVTFTGIVELSGSKSAIHRFKNKELTLDSNEEHSYWVCYQPSDNITYRCSIYMSLATERRYYFNSIGVQGDLSNGWNTYSEFWGGVLP